MRSHESNYKIGKNIKQYRICSIAPEIAKKTVNSEH